MATQALRNRRSFVYPDHSNGAYVHRSEAPRGYVRRHGRRHECRAQLQAGLAYALVGVKTSIRYLMKHDLPLAATSALVVLGLVFNVFALVAYTFQMDGNLGITFGSFGTGLWLFAAAVFAIFLSRQQPRHGTRR
jgi:hypothetical protein